jgi:hypothetical protein
MGNDQLGCSATKRYATGDHFIRDHCKRVQVTPPINTPGLGLFGRNVLWCSHKHAGARQALFIRLWCLRNPKIGQNDTTITIN